MHRFWVVGAMVALSCGPVGPPQEGAYVAPLTRDRVAVRQGEQTLATLPVDSVDLDRVEVALAPDGAGLAAVVHHGRHGGASLLSWRADGWDRLWTTDPDNDLSAPLWSPDGDALFVVRRLPSRWGPTAPPRLEHRGQIWRASDEGLHRVGEVGDASRVIGWVSRGSLLFTRLGPGDTGANEGLARIDLTHLAVRDLVPPAEPRRHQRFAMVDGRIEVRGTTSAGQDGEGVLIVHPDSGRVATGPQGRAPTPGQVRQIRGSALLPPDPSLLAAALSMPYVHQVYDTPNDFNGNWACGPTSTLMAVQHFGRLPKWPHTVNIPQPHNSDYGAYVAYKYTAFGSTFDRTQNDASGKPAKGAYGWCTDNGAAWAWRMQDYAKRHDLKSDFSGSPSFAKVEAELKAGKVVVLSTQLTSAGHIITVKGIKDGKLLTNDPYGDRNLPSYPNTKGENAVYTWAKVASKWYITVHGAATYPKLTITSAIDSISGQERDFCQDGKSSGIFDWKVAQTTHAHIDVKNKGTAIASNVKVGLWAESPYIEILKWNIYTDWKQDGSFVLNDTDGLQSVPHDSPGQSFTLNIGAMSVGETKRIKLEIKALQFSVGAADHPDIRAWVKNIDGYYTKSDFSATPDNVKSYQTFNGGDLRAYSETDVLSDEVCDQVDNDCDGLVDEDDACPSGESDGGTTLPDSGAPPMPDADPQRGLQPQPLVGGCSVAGGSGGLPPLSLLLLALAALRRRRPPAGRAPARPGRRRTRWSPPRNASGCR